MNATRVDLMGKRAREMAKSGKFEDSLSIEMALRREGFREAKDWLREDSVRNELNLLCREARGS